MRVLFFVLLVSLLTSCTNTNADPAGIIPRQKMETIVWQLLQSDEYVNARLTRDSTRKASTEKMKIYQQVYDLNGISPDEFKKSYRYYLSRPDISKTMFDSITAKAGRQRAEIYKVKPDTSKPRPVAAPVKKDSLAVKPLLHPGADTTHSKKTVKKLKPGKHKLDTAKFRLHKPVFSPATKVGAASTH